MKPTSKLKKLLAFLVLPLIAAIGVSAAPSIPPAPETAPNNFNSDVYRVEKTLVDSAGQVGENIRYRIRFEALRDIDQARIMESLPGTLAMVDLQPAPTETSSSAYLWVFSNMTRGSVQEIFVTAKPTSEGWSVTNTKIAVVPMIALPVYAGQPKLELDKTGPAVAELGDNVVYKLTVRNVGTAPAPNVILTDTLPGGLFGTDRSTNVVTHKLGTIAAGESRTVDVPVKAGVKGEWDNQANAYSSHYVQANATAHISIVESKVSITKTGPSTAFVFGNVCYVITIRNEGDTDLRNIRLTDELPEGAQFQKASDGGEYRSGQVVWTIDSLPRGSSVQRTVCYTAMKPSVASTTATASLTTGRQVQASVVTTWEGAPGVLTEVLDDVDPVKVGGRVVYTVRVTNQSPIRELTSTGVLEFAPMLRIAEVSKNVTANIDGQRLTIQNISLKPKGVLTFKVTAEAVTAGMGGVRFEFGADFLPRAVIKEETTYVY